MRNKQLRITHESHQFSHQDAERIYWKALQSPAARMILIDLAKVTEATTSAFARLVLLRRALRRCGADLLLIGLRGRAALLYEVNRLADVLPSEPPLSLIPSAHDAV